MNENENYEIVDTELTKEVEVYQLDYALLNDRYKAMALDVGINVLSLTLFSYVFSYYEVDSDELRKYLFFFLFFFYDPFFTSMFGATIGQNMFNLTVRKEKDTSKKINFFIAIWRFLFKSSLGIISLLTVGSHPKRKAIHDQVAGSVVIYKRK